MRHAADQGRHRLGLPEWTVLAVAAERPVHGFAVAALTASDGELGRVWQIPRPVVYRAIGRLVDAGLITAEAVETGGGPPRTLYASTAEGRGLVDAWLLSPVPHVRDLRSEFLLKLAIRHRRGADPAPLVAAQREALEPIVVALREEQAGADDFDCALVAWRRVSAEAALRFLDEL
ncbi:Transcriptional regulator, PadR family [Pseudonocardia sp. Ae168_Ps1]|uniref:PadR family transcriptional regulator n=1 Tax=unclassified Pseudonocardia TaxID=2619320 RepID=UPI00094B0413|nr:MULTISPECIES: PadR family transcriptional regulator [unclassified Pseudonocardia]OLL74807.1 Transcriptional regulator, PadR family [Pseudonocardia sp. Ae150A_Ps1]OLL80799.1 Transcriptional regulator, PadR family [Pseudonocardia sp. Ae168_Ps1]OLL85083.1 Transcriptional regulator, PadR family [Pseudonocardia sp. Ae263_Ps1]OLL94900.1 Transcriptional regulator, PadR family [Pseudonocardia sp. Ae356_Ps1]